jgi:propanediol utilization protein
MRTELEKMLVRVDTSYKLEVHIDTDEGKRAICSPKLLRTVEMNFMIPNQEPATDL